MLPILELLRGGIVESTHYGSIAVVDSSGKLLYSYGDPNAVAFLRSSAKPFQALPFIERGGAEHFNYTQSEIALSCASHETAQIHLDTVKGMQAKIGIREDDLQCGPHMPGDAANLRKAIKQDVVPTKNFNNCSGKHTSMLAHAKMRGLSLENYLANAHPIQEDILNTLSEICSIEKEKIILGIDGCSAPNFAIPLFNAALGMARMCDPRDLPDARKVACGKITSAMAAHPEMVSNYGEFDCELMQVGAGKIITKRGAEGFQIMGLIPGVHGELGVGIAFKIVDGDAAHFGDDLESRARVRPATSLEILRQLKALNDSQLQALAKFGPTRELRNYAGLLTGKSRTVFVLK
jgi:L-asparaginase II